MTASSPLYLDHAAATPMHPAVIEAIAEAQAVAGGNPSSQHAVGRAARRMLEDSRDRILELLDCRGGGHRDRLVFTSGASEANHLAILGMTAAVAAGEVWFSRRDHASSTQAARTAACRGWRLRELPLDHDLGTAAAAVVAAMSEPATDGPRIVSLTLACGQTGSVETAPPRGDEAPRYFFHVDATQAVGLMPVSFRELSVATLTIAPHKFGGPRGIGGLIVRDGVPLAPLQAGTQEFGLRGGTEAVPLAVGFARALDMAVIERDVIRSRVAALRDQLESRLVVAARQAGIPAFVIAGAGPRCPHIATIAFPGLDRQALSMAADLAGVCLATGTACASGASEPAPALVAMGLDPAAIRGTIRLSVGRTTTPADIEEAVVRLTPLLGRGPQV